MAVELLSTFVRCVHERGRDAALITREGGRDEIVTWTEIAERAGAWLSELDRTVDQSATVAVTTTDVVDTWCAALGVFASGRGFLPLPSQVTEGERAALVAAAPNLAFVIRPCEDVRVARLAPDRATGARLCLRTSGSTGRPRLVERVGEAIDRVALTLVRTLGTREGDRVVSFLPPHHSYGIEHAVLLPIMSGLTVVTSPRFSPAALHELFALAGTRSLWPTTPAMLDAMTGMPPTAPPSVMYTAGAQVPLAVIERFIESWNVTPGNLYGASETGTIAFARDARDGLEPVDGVNVRIADEEGGEILVKSDAMMRGYIPLDATAFRDGFFPTGDLGRMESGRLWIEGRLKLQFDVGGLKVNPIEVESHLLSHGSVREAVVVPVRLSASVLRAHAIVVVGGDGANIDELRRYLRERLPPHMVPRTIEVRDALPKTSTGKVDRRLLSDEL